MVAFLTGKRLLAAWFVTIGIIMLRETYTAETGFLANSVGMGPMTYPRYLLIGWLGASVLYLIVGGPRNEAESIRGSGKAILIAAGLMAAYVLMFYYLGLFLSTLIFLWAFFHAEGYRNVKVGLLTAGVSSFLFWFVFERLLQVPMPEGFIGALFGY